MIFESLGKYKDLGFLILRLGIGGMFIIHGYPLLTGGTARWEQLGMATGNVGIHFAPVVFGFLAAASEFLGGICLILGLFFRPACLFLTVTMIVAAVMHAKQGEAMTTGSHAIESAILFFSLMFIGLGSYSVSIKK